MGKLKKEDMLSRVLLHIPVGMFNAWLCLAIPFLGIVFGIGFIFYEKNDDRHTKDQAWKDIYGWLVGLALGAIIMRVMKVW